MSKNPLDLVYEKQTKSAIHGWGRNVNVIWGSTANCSSCGYNPISKEATNVACDTCEGQFFYQTENTLRAKGVLKTFVGDMGFRDYVLRAEGYFPDSDARITFWLEDVLLNPDSASGVSYVDEGKNIRLETDGKKYEIQSTQRTGIDQLKVIVCVAKEKK